MLGRYRKFFNGRKVRTKIIVLMMAVAYLSIFMISSLIYYVGTDTLSGRISGEIERNGEQILESINRMIYERYNDMQILISDSILADSESRQEDKQNVLAQMQESKQGKDMKEKGMRVILDNLQSDELKRQKALILQKSKGSDKYLSGNQKPW